MRNEHQKWEPDCQSRAQCLNETANPRRDELQSNSTYLRMLAEHLERLAEVDEMLVLG